MTYRPNLIEVVASRKRGETLKRLCDEIAEETNAPTILLILGQEKFRELKLNQELQNNNKTTQEEPAAGGNIDDVLSIMKGINFGSTSTPSKSADVKTIKDAFTYILSHGPEVGVHTIMQLDKPDHFLFEDYFNKKTLESYFKHLVLLRSEEIVAAKLQLQDDVKLHKMESNPLRLRAYYYNNESDKYTLFTPYMLPKIEILNKLINN